jgi:hypothetical protein
LHIVISYSYLIWLSYRIYNDSLISCVVLTIHFQYLKFYHKQFINT